MTKTTTKFIHMLFLASIMALSVRGTCKEEKPADTSEIKQQNQERVNQINKDNALGEADKLLKDINNL